MRIVDGVVKRYGWGERVDVEKRLKGGARIYGDLIDDDLRYVYITRPILLPLSKFHLHSYILFSLLIRTSPPPAYHP